MGSFPVLTGKWTTRFAQSGGLENFQVDGAAPVRVPMMQQDNYPVKMGVDSDLGCTVSVMNSFKRKQVIVQFHL